MASNDNWKDNRTITENAKAQTPSFWPISPPRGPLQAGDHHLIWVTRLMAAAQARLLNQAPEAAGRGRGRLRRGWLFSYSFLHFLFSSSPSQCWLLRFRWVPTRWAVQARKPAEVVAQQPAGGGTATGGGGQPKKLKNVSIGIMGHGLQTHQQQSNKRTG